MSWAEFKHAFQRCSGPEVGREYIPPSGRAIKNASEQLAREMLDGVTLFHYRCRTCGKRWTVRELGDWREGERAA